MNSKSKPSILGDNFMRFVLSDGDALDRLAKRAIEVVLATNKRQTGDEADTDLFVANQYAEAALAILSENCRPYSFVNITPDVVDPLQGGLVRSSYLDAVATAQAYVSRAETLLPGADPDRVKARDESAFADSSMFMRVDAGEKVGQSVSC